MELPDLEGQPGWVVVVVVALIVLGTLGLAYLRRRGVRPEETEIEAGGDGTLLAEGNSTALVAVREAMNFLTIQAQRANEEADEAEEEARRLREQLDGCRETQGKLFTANALLEEQCRRLQVRLEACEDESRRRRLDP